MDWPASAEEVAAILRMAMARDLVVVPSGGFTQQAIGFVPPRVDILLRTSRMKSVRYYDPGDLTFGAEAGITVAEIEQRLAEKSQWLPFDVPQPQSATLGGVLATAAHGPLKHAFGGVREFCIGVTFVTGDGTVAKGGGRVVNVSQRNGILNDLRSSKDQGQSNFNNPGTMLVGAGADLDILPQLRVSPQLNHLWFATTEPLKALRHEDSIPKSIGWDLSTAIVYRPSMVQNAVFRLSGAVLQPDSGFKDLFTNSKGQKRYYSVLFNAILAF